MMTRALDRWALVAVATILLPTSACGPTVALSDGTADGSGSGTGTRPTTSVADGVDGVDDTDSGPTDDFDIGGPECGPGQLACTDRLDVLFVVDNSSTMAEEQRVLARSLPRLVDQLRDIRDPNGEPVALDIQVMVTTTDVGNPLCTPFEPPGYAPARGAPLTTPCTSRLQDFTDPFGMLSVPEICLDACPAGIQPDDPFLAFGPEGSNVPPVPEVDIDGDGQPDSPEAQALACIGLPGISGCGYESPLEAMRLALDPDAEHNVGDRPFVRPDAALAIFILTDEADCSVADESIMGDPTFYNVDPDSGVPRPSSAICWNAGVECEGPDAGGVYSQCWPRPEEYLHSVDRYMELLRGELGAGQHKDIFMLPIVGVPVVVAHDPNPPFQPIAGGEADLVHRNWQDGPYPNGDILPDDWAQGLTAADKQFDFGIGPGCTDQDGRGTFTGQAIPPVRMLDVCHGLDFEDESGEQIARCCVESICDDDFQGAITCLNGMLPLPGGGLFPATG